MSELLEPTSELLQPIQDRLLLKTVKRNGTIVSYDENKIRRAITKAFIAEEGTAASASDRVHEQIAKMAAQVTAVFMRRLASGGTVHIEEIQDQVELTLMRGEHYRVARAYLLYREAHRKDREAEMAKQLESVTTLMITMPDGELKPLDEARILTIVEEACRALADVSPDPIIKDAMRNLYQKATLADVHKALVMGARALVEQEPNYAFVSARLLLDSLRTEALTKLGMQTEATFDEMTSLYPSYFKNYLAHGIKQGILTEALAEFDIDALAAALVPARDMQFNYLGLQTLYDRYFIHEKGVRYELPQAFFMRVAMGLALREGDKNARAIQFYHLLSSFDYMASTPTLFNSGTVRPQLSSCYLSTFPDDLEGIYNGIRDNALLSKFSGGLGMDATAIRAMGAHIAGTNGKSQGVVPFLKVMDTTLIAVNQGGKRRGAGCAYLECWHLDIEEFLELRKNTGDDRRRTHDMNTAVWLPDLFMERVKEENGMWTLFSPDEVPDLHELYGREFNTRYAYYEQMAKQGKIQLSREVSAQKLWRKMLSMLFETGHPWITFKDTCNLRSPEQHAGVVHSSNLCTEITLNTSADEIAVCNLGSVNLPRHIVNGVLDCEKLKETVQTAIRMLDNVIDINYYSVPQARHSNLQHRPIGLGMMGFQDALYEMGLDYASNEAVLFADETMELISYYAIQASSLLASERGTYRTYEGSLWSKGILPIDSISLVKQARKTALIQDRTQRLDWEALRIKVRTQGMRNSNVMAIAPTATISNICHVSQSIEPMYQNLHVKSNLSGEFTVINPYLVTALKALNLWDEVMVNDLKYFNGSVLPISRIPNDLKRRFATAFEIEPKWLIDCASRRQKWIDQAQSLNIYMAKPSGKKLDELYYYAWVSGLKTTYYLRSLGASNAERSTVTDGALNAVKVDAPKACSILDPDCEACQ